MKTHGNDEEKSRAAGRAAGYCWARNPDGPGRCTRPPHDDGQHIDHNNGRRSLTDTSGWTWANDPGPDATGPVRKEATERHAMHESNTLAWATSSYSGGNGACIEVAKTAGGAFFRDTKDRRLGAASASDTAWGAFLNAVKAEAFHA